MLKVVQCKVVLNTYYESHLFAYITAFGVCPTQIGRHIGEVQVYLSTGIFVQ